MGYNGVYCYYVVLNEIFLIFFISYLEILVGSPCGLMRVFWLFLIALVGVFFPE